MRFEGVNKLYADKRNNHYVIFKLDRLLTSSHLR